MLKTGSLERKIWNIKAILSYFPRANTCDLMVNLRTFHDNRTPTSCITQSSVIRKPRIEVIEVVLFQLLLLFRTFLYILKFITL